LELGRRIHLAEHLRRNQPTSLGDPFDSKSGAARILYRWAGGWVLIVLAEIKPELLDTDSAGKRDSHARTATAEKRLRRLEILFVAAG